MIHSSQSAASRWLKASEVLGDDIGIRFGRIPDGSDEVEWFGISHCECDGIGGFARLLRSQDTTIPRLPETRNSCRGLLGPLCRTLFGNHRPSDCATRKDWMPEGARLPDVPNHVAWHVFTEMETRGILESCRSRNITVNSLLLKNLDAVVRPELGITNKRIPWMVPVNLRGDVTYTDDTGNHVSWLDVFVAPDESPESLQRQIRCRLDRGEHRAIHLLMKIGALAGRRLMVKYLAWDRNRQAGNIGAFSNLGAWDCGASDDVWLFCPPVVLGQRLAAGCVTFRNRLSLMIQSHPYGSSPRELMRRWMDRWVDGIASFRS